MPGGYGEMPATYGQMPGGYGEMPATYGQMPTGYSQMPAGYPVGYQQAVPRSFPTAQNPAEFTQAAPGMPGAMYGAPAMGEPYDMRQTPYGQMPYGYPQMNGQVPQSMGVTEFEATQAVPGQMPYMQGYQDQGLPVGTGTMVDCGCGPAPTMGMMPAAEAVPNAVIPNFVPPTPPIYSAPYTGPANVAQPPYMNPYGLGPVGTSAYGMPGYRDESD
jgi:morphogenetic protein associated with SpoVID